MAKTDKATKPERENGTLFTRQSTTGVLMPMVAETWEEYQWVGSFDPQSAEGSRRAIKSDVRADVTIEGLDGEPHLVEHWSCERREYLPDGETEPVIGLRIVLYTPTGETLITSSLAVARAMDRLIVLQGPGPYDPPIGLRFARIRTPRGRYTYDVTSEY